MMNDTEEAVAVDTHLPENPHSPMHPVGGDGPRASREDFLVCRRCQSASVANHKFCSQCGEPLWEPCVHCGEIGPAAERFCGFCGANLVAAIHQQTEQFEMDLLTVEQFQAEGRYDEAMALLGPISSIEHPRLNHHAKLATEFIKRLDAERKQALDKAEQLCGQAQGRFEAHDYAGTIHLLEDVPAGLRSEAFQNLLTEAGQRQEEVAALRRQFRAAIAGKKISAALPVVGRLLELQPDHAQARQIAEKMQKRFAQAAEAKLAKYHYAEAVKVLGQVPESLRGGEMAALGQRAGELAWIAWDLRNAAAVDGPLLSMASRLRKLAPGDPRGEKLAAEMRRRCGRRRKTAGWPRPRGPRGPRIRPWDSPSTGSTAWDALPPARRWIDRSSPPIPAASPSPADWRSRGWGSRRCGSISTSVRGKAPWAR